MLTAAGPLSHIVAIVLLYPIHLFYALHMDECLSELKKGLVLQGESNMAALRTSCTAGVLDVLHGVPL